MILERSPATTFPLWTKRVYPFPFFVKWGGIQRVCAIGKQFAVFNRLVLGCIVDMLGRRQIIFESVFS
jgi:hypothetical protein